MGDFLKKTGQGENPTKIKHHPLWFLTEQVYSPHQKALGYKACIGPTGEMMHNGRVWVPALPCAAGMHNWNKENTLTFPVAPNTVHLRGIGGGLHRARFRGSPLLSSGALSEHWGVGAPAAALLAVAAAADRLRLNQPACAARGGRVAGTAVSEAANQRGAVPGRPVRSGMRAPLEARA